MGRGDESGVGGVIDETRLAYMKIVQAGWWGHGGSLFIPFSFCVFEHCHDKKLKDRNQRCQCLIHSFPSWLCCYVIISRDPNVGNLIMGAFTVWLPQRESLMDDFWRVEQSGFPRKVMLKWIMQFPCSVMQLGGWALVKCSGKSLGWCGPCSRHLLVQCRKDPHAPAVWLSPLTTVSGLYLCFRLRATAGTMQQSQVHPASRLSGHDILRSLAVFQ